MSYRNFLSLINKQSNLVTTVTVITHNILIFLVQNSRGQNYQIQFYGCTQFTAAITKKILLVP